MKRGKTFFISFSIIFIVLVSYSTMYSYHLRIVNTIYSPDKNIQKKSPAESKPDLIDSMSGIEKPDLSISDDDNHINYLRMQDSTDNYLYYYLDDSVNRTNGITIETRTRLVNDMQGAYGPLGIYIQDGTHCFIVSVGESFVSVDYGNQLKYLWTDGGTFQASTWHVYRLTAKEGALNVYVDGSSIGEPWTTQRTDYTNHLRFGCLWSSTYKGIIDWDYFYVAQDEEIAPPAAPIWDITLDMDDYPTNQGWDSDIGIGNNVSLVSDEVTSYEHSFSDTFTNLDNWENSTNAYHTIDGDMEFITPAGQLKADSYGTTDLGWHGPAVYRNFDDITDFRIEFDPSMQASTNEMGGFWMLLYSGENGTGTRISWFRWADRIETGGSNANIQLYDSSDSIIYNSGDTAAVGSWDDVNDNMTLVRDGSTLYLYLDGSLVDTNLGESITTINSIVIHFTQWWYQPICDDLRLDKLILDYNSTTSSPSPFYEHSFSDDFANLDNWSASPNARYPVGGSMTTNNSYVYGETFGNGSDDYHGPAIYRNFSMIDFRLEIVPKCQASAWEMGVLSISFYSGPTGSGTALWNFQWYDAWYNADSDGTFVLFDQNRNRLHPPPGGESAAIGSWNDFGDNMTITRSSSTLKLYIDGTLENTNITQSTETVGSVVIQFCQNMNDRPICDELSLDKIEIAYNSPPIILVDGDADFHIQAQSEGWDLGGSRNGTSSHPYVIEGYNLTDSTTDLMVIRNTRVYFIIQNNIFDGVLQRHTGIRLYNVTHGTLVNNSILRNDIGIDLNHLTSNVSIDNNSITNTRVGIQIRESMYNTISRNRVNTYTWGIRDDALGIGRKNVISNNNVSNGEIGIYLIEGYYTNITNNNVYNNSQEGIEVVGRTHYVLIDNNSIYECHGGIYLYATSDSNIANNIIHNIHDYGIKMQGFPYDMSLNCSNNDVINNSIYNVNVGIYFDAANENTVDNNILYNLDYQGIYISRSDSMFISFNTVVNSSDYAINCSSWDTVIQRNTLIDNNQNGGSQAYAEGVESLLFENTIFFANYWSDWTEPDDDGNGIVDVPYSIDGNIISQDLYPLVNLVSSYHMLPPLLSFPIGGETLAGLVLIEWNVAHDLQKHQLLYSVFYSVDGGTTWILLESDLDTTQLEWNTTEIADGSTYFIKIIANCTEGLVSTITSANSFTIDHTAPQIFLTGLLNNSVIGPTDLINFTINDLSFSTMWYKWDDNTTDLTLTSPWSIAAPTSEGYHWLSVSATDSVGHLTEMKFSFIVNYYPRIEVLTPLNGSVVSGGTPIHVNFTDITGLHWIWYNWDSQSNITVTNPDYWGYSVFDSHLGIVPESQGIHYLNVYSNDTHGWIKTISVQFYVDVIPPSIILLIPENNTAISPGIVIKLSISDYLLDYSYYQWDDDIYLTLTEPWTMIAPTSEGYHWLTVSTNDSVGLLTTTRYRFYVNSPPLIELQSLNNNSVILPLTEITFEISDPLLFNAWYQWDYQGNNSLKSPFIVQAINSSGYHVISIVARDNQTGLTIKTYRFYILGSASIETTQQPPTTVFSGESFIYSFTIINTEAIPLNLELFVFGADDDVLTGNGSHILLTSGENVTFELEIKPKHASLHQLEIYLFHDSSLFYHKILEFNVEPQWLSPTSLLQLSSLIIFLFFVVIISVTSIYYIRRQSITRRKYWEQHAQLIQLIDKLTIANLEATIATSSEDSFSGPLGFSQHLQLLEPLNREVIEQEYYSLRERIMNGDPNNLQKLTKLLNQAEELLKDNKEV